MQHAARRFARRTLLLHTLLLAVVLATVAVAARSVYQAARDEVLQQAEAQQQLLAGETARGIQSHYKSILDDMDLLRRADAAATPTTAPAGRTPAELALERLLTFSNRNPGAGQVIGGVIWRQLQGRASLLFGLDRTPAGASPTTGRPPPSIRLVGSDDAKVTPDTVVKRSGPWLRAQVTPSVGPFERWGDVAGNLVCVPLRDEAGATVPVAEPARFTGRRGFNRGGDRPPADEGPGSADEPPPDDREPAVGREPAVDRESSAGREPPGGRREGAGRPATRPTGRPARALVAVVPIGPVEQEFLRPLGDPATGAWLIDQQGTAMAASRADLVGMDITKLRDPDLKRLAARYSAGHMAGCEVIDRPFAVGAAHFAPAMVAAEPVTIANRHWELFVATSLEAVDGSVDRLFRRALWWGGGVAVTVAAILASTAASLIRGRMRVERLRHEVLTRELEQARQIQLAWLPKAVPVAAAVDVAAVNSPASHISGDFYNWFDLPDGRLAVAIGDVTGHGMAAAFLMATTQLLVRTTLARVADPGTCLAEVNRQLCSQAFNGQFVTMLVAVIDPARRRLDLATAGHPSPLVTDGKAFAELPVEPQLVLGIECDAEYATETFDLPPGAGLLLYTDGVVECPAGDRTPDRGQRFGTARLRLAVGGPTALGSARSLVDRVVSAVDAFRGPGELDDDLTVVAVRLRPAAVLGGPLA